MNNNDIDNFLENIHDKSYNIKYQMKTWFTKLDMYENNIYIKLKIYKKAFEIVPNSYKIWFNFLKDSIKYIKNNSIIINFVNEMSKYIDKCLNYMRKMPRIWMMVMSLYLIIGNIKCFRRIFYNCLRSLPISQHDKIWEFIFKQLDDIYDYKNLKINLMKKYLQINPNFKENFVEYLINKEEYNLSCKYLLEILNDDNYFSKQRKTTFDFSLIICKIISEYPQKVTIIDNKEDLIKNFIIKYKDEEGNLWVSLANMYINLGEFQKARYIFEEGLSKVNLVKSFGIIYNSYLKFEDEILKILFEEDDNEDIIEENNQNIQIKSEINNKLQLKNDEFEENFKNINSKNLAIERLENLLNRRELLLNNCLIKQDPNNIEAWSSRLKLFQNNFNLIKNIFFNGLSTINISISKGKLSIFINTYLNILNKNNLLNEINITMSLILNCEFKNSYDFIEVFLNYFEILLLNKYYLECILFLRNIIFNNFLNDVKYNQEIKNSLKILELLSDLELNFGNFESYSKIKDYMINNNLINGLGLINYCNILIHRKQYTKAFKIYDKAINIFEWPALESIWINYLKNFELIYKNEKLERLKDLYERVLLVLPPEYSLNFYFLYSELEFKFGLYTNSIGILERMVNKISKKEKYIGYQLFIIKVIDILGVTKSRLIFDKALKEIDDYEIVELGLIYINIEKKIGEIDRARQIFSYICQFSDPEVDEFDFWKNWDIFEINYGNEETNGEMLWNKREQEEIFELLPPSWKRLEKKIKIE